jgi:hypothetical protein
VREVRAVLYSGCVRFMPTPAHKHALHTQNNKMTNTHLDVLRDGVIRHVDGRVTQALNQVLLVPGQPRAQAKRARARPLLQPAC